MSGFEALAKVLPVNGKSAGTDPTTPPTEAGIADVAPIRYSQDASESPEEYNPLADVLGSPIQLEGDIDTSGFDPFVEAGLSFDLGPGFDFSDAPDVIDLPLLEDLESSIIEMPEYGLDTVSNVSCSPLPQRSLLLDYYRVPNPSPTSHIDDIESKLVQHYFKEVCILFSSFDSLLNPFRTTIGRIFQESPSIYYAIQSMAAAHLANTIPNMTEVGKMMQRRACDSLQAELPAVQSGQTSGTVTFLSIVLLGMTTSWHQSNALGEEFLAMARSLIVPKLICNTSREEVRRETQFFEEALIYWEMLMGFVTQDTVTCSSGSVLRQRSRTAPQPAEPSTRARFIDGKIVPHPWTGIAPSIQLLFAEVGRLVRKERLLHLYGSPDLLIQQQQNLTDARSLEEDLLAAEYPGQQELADPGDVRTPKRDFLVLAEAYRCAGLLELYRVFPYLLRRRLGLVTCDDNEGDPSTQVDTDTDTHTVPDTDTNGCTADFFVIPWTTQPAEQHLGISAFSAPATPPFTNPSQPPVPFPPPPRFSTPHETTDTTIWLNSLALHILSLLSSLPPTSGTCCLQPILFVAAASELRLTSSIDYFDVHGNDSRVLGGRRFAERRLEEFAMRLPEKPLRRCLQIVREVWRRGDEGMGVFWVDVVVQMGWETVMG